MMNRFSPEVAIRLGYYVYRLIDPRNGLTFYVGKGKGNRVFDHVECAIKHSENSEEIKDDPEKLKIIRQIQACGLEVIHVIQRWNLTEKEAFQVEAALIDAYQGLSNIQSGHGSEFGVANAEALERRLSCKVYEEPNDFKYVIIKVKESQLDRLQEKYPSTYRYEATRYAWRTSPKDTTKYPYVFSVTNGIVKAVYKINEWYFVEQYNRYAFHGEEADHSVSERFVNKRIPDTYCRRGIASPVLFSKN